MSKVKCPICEDVVMDLVEGTHTCPECDKTLSLSEADELFEAGKLTMVSEEDDKKDEEDDKKDEEDDEEDMKKESQISKLSSIMSEYSVVSKILRAGKKGQMSEEWITDLVESLIEKTDINIHQIDMKSITELAESVIADQALISEDLVKALASDETISEDVKLDVVTVFEAAIAMKAKSIDEANKEAYEEKLEEAKVALKVEAEATVDAKLDEVTKVWMEENKLAVESGLKTEMTESFILGLKTLFEDHFIDIPAAKVDIVDKLAEQVAELEAKLEEKALEEVKVMAKIVEMKTDAILKTVAEGLADTQVEKLKELAESVEFVEDKSYTAKLTKLKESFLSEKVEVIAKKVELDEGLKPKSSNSHPDYITAAVAALNANS